MTILFVAYILYLILYGLVSYAIIFHLLRFRVDGDRSRTVIILYIIVSLVVVKG